MKKFLAIAFLMGVSLTSRADLESIKARVPKIVDFKERGLIGEKADGLLGVVKSDPEAEKIVSEENKDRLEEYHKRAEAQKQSLETFMKVLGEARIRTEKAGRMVQPSGEWIKK